MYSSIYILLGKNDGMISVSKLKGVYIKFSFCSYCGNDFLIVKLIARIMIMIMMIEK